MCNACISILVGVASLVSKILLLFGCLQKRPNFPFGAKKFDQLELAQKIHASRSGCIMCVHQFWLAGLFGFEDFAPFKLLPKTAKFPFRAMGYSPWVLKNLIN